MNASEPTWERAIMQILEEASEPMHYKAITRAIFENRIKSSEGLTPERTVAAILSQRVGAESPDGRKVIRIGDGEYQLGPDSVAQVNREEDPPEIENTVITIASYGLYWDKNKINWWPGQTGRIRLLGRAMGTEEEIDFADQQGVYLLHQGMEVMYVGRAAGKSRSLFYRLRSHRDDLSKAPLWDRFSWFGFREVQPNGSMKRLEDSADVPIKALITILETVLIQSSLPRLNGQRGELLGTIYEQVTDPELV